MDIPIDEVFGHLKCSREGLTSAEAAKRLEAFGANKLEEKNESKLFKFLGFMWNPLSWVMECAAIMAIILANGGVLLIIPFLIVSFLHIPHYFTKQYDIFQFILCYAHVIMEDETLLLLSHHMCFLRIWILCCG